MATSPAAVAAPSPAPVPLHIEWGAALVEHLHNKIVHFPIALGVAAAVILLVSPRWPQYDAAARALLVAAAVFSLAAYFTGDAQKRPFWGTPLWGIADIHEQLGIVTTIALCLGVVLTPLRPVKRWLWVYAIVLIALISATGLVGGVLAHTEI